MGEGDDDLGQLLMSNFIKAIKDLDKLPQKMVFYNKGVTLATKTSPLIDHLTDLEKMGVELLLCATCVNHYAICRYCRSRYSEQYVHYCRGYGFCRKYCTPLNYKQIAL